MVLSNEGRIFVWGRGSFGRLGSGTEKDHYSPVEVFLPGMPCTLICHQQIVLADRINTRLHASIGSLCDDDWLGPVKRAAAWI